MTRIDPNKTLIAIDKYAIRGRGGRNSFFWLTTIIVLLALPLTIRALCLKFEIENGLLLGLIPASMLYAWLWQYIVFFISGNKYLVVTGADGELQVFGPGWRARYPTDEPREDGNYLADVRKVPFDEMVAAKDGLAIHVEGLVLYQLDPGHMAVFDSVDPTQREMMIRRMGKAMVTARLPHVEAEVYREGTTAEEETMLASYRSKQNSIKSTHGVRIVGVIIDSADYGPDVQEARDAAAETAAVLATIAKGLIGDKIEGDLKGFPLVAQMLAEGRIGQSQFDLVTRMALAQTNDAKLEFIVHDYNIKGLENVSPELAQAVAGVMNKIAPTSKSKGGKK